MHAHAMPFHDNDTFSRLLIHSINSSPNLNLDLNLELEAN